MYWQQSGLYGNNQTPLLRGLVANSGLTKKLASRSIFFTKDKLLFILSYYKFIRSFLLFSVCYLRFNSFSQQLNAH
jgi:hypothetical protein